MGVRARSLAMFLIFAFAVYICSIQIRLEQKLSGISADISILREMFQLTIQGPNGLQLADLEDEGLDLPPVSQRTI